MPEYNFAGKMFGAEIAITVYDVEEHIAEMVCLDTYQEGLRLQKIFNFYDPKSELSKLNLKRKLECTDDLLKVIKHALEYSEKTNGMYDISLGRMFLDRKKKGTAKRPDCSYRDIIINGNQVILANEKAAIDLGSIAKGYIVDRLVDFMRDKGVEEGLIDGRGDIRVFGNREHLIGIQHPREDRIIDTVAVRDKAIATSGDYMQYIGNYDQSHIVGNQLASVTVIADTLENADLFATVISVSGRDMVVPGLRVIMVDRDMKVHR